MCTRLAFIVSTCLFVVSGLISPVAAAPPKPLKVLLVTGGCCHDYDTQKNLLAEGIAARAHVEVTVVHQGGSATNAKIPLYAKADWAKGYDLVIHDECFADVKDPAYTQRVLAPHQAGTPALVLHCAMHCYRDGTDNWFKFCGVTSRRHGAQYPHEVLNRDASHPVMKTFGAGWANPAGELYWIEKVWPTAHPLASSKNREKGNEEVCVWTNQYGKARVFGTTLGHHNETVSHDKYLTLITRGVLWACDKLSDEYLKKPAARLVPVNLATGGKATASSEETAKNNFAPKAFDNNPATRWCANGPGLNQWLQVDMGKPQKLLGAEIDWENRRAGYKFKLQGSADGQTWQTLVDASKQFSTTRKHKLNAPGTRYVRLSYYGCDQGSWGSVWELKLHGDKTEKIEPPATGVDPRNDLLREVKAPEGFEAKIFAAPPAVNYPVYVAAAAEDNSVFVSVDKNGSLDRKPRHGSVYRLRDLDGDGRADESKMYIADVDSPRGLVWDRDRLYLMHPPHLSAFIDKDGDGISDEQKILVKNIAFTFKDRPADHTSNGVTLGIDGWLYLAIGDFGMMQAEGADGTKLQFRGGGVLRVRPDGSGLEVYSRGTRNILEAGVDPLLNGFTRDNTNDGGGWDIRLHHFSGMEHHGYPSLYMNFGEEIVQPLADYGGGSGCGALYMSEPGMPKGYGDAMYTADWGRSIIFRHQMTANGATFKADQTEFLRLPRVTDLDVDAHSRIYATSWKGATFKYAGDNVGFVTQVTPKGYKPQPMPQLATATNGQLLQLLTSPSHRRRLAAQRELISRKLAPADIQAIQKVAAGKDHDLAVRVAALFTLKQSQGASSHAFVASLFDDASIREYVVRVLTDRKDELKGFDGALLIKATTSGNPRIRLQAAIAIARLGDKKLAPHVTSLLTDSDPLVSHTAAHVLISLQAAGACLASLDEENATARQRIMSLRALQGMHTQQVVTALIDRLQKATDPARRAELFTALCRLYFVEGEWKGNSWGTRPDTRGPYYQPEEWSESSRIAVALGAALNSAGQQSAPLIVQLSRHRVELKNAVPAMIAAASRDASLLPVVVSQFAGGGDIPPAAIPLLARAAADDTIDAEVRGKAVIALLRAGGNDAFNAALRGLSRLPAGKKSKASQQARSNFLRAQTLTPKIELLLKLAAQPQKQTATWADAGLLELATGNSKQAAAALASVKAGWKAPARRVQLIRASVATNQRLLLPEIRSAANGDDAAAAKAAREALTGWGIETGATSGPKLAGMKPADIIAKVAKRGGNAAMGVKVFTRLQCNKCHTVDASEPQRGPFLPLVAKTYKRNQLAEAVLTPGKSIAQGFVTNLFVMESGELMTGFVTKEEAGQVIIRDKEGKEHVLPAGEIEERVKQTVSLMPEGLANDLTMAEFAALLDYLQSLAK